MGTRKQCGEDMNAERWRGLGLRTLMLVIWFGLSVSVMAQQGPSWYYQVDEHNVGIGGHDPVAYFTEGKALEGKPGIEATHEGVVYHFATKANRKAFQKGPDRYVPRFGGWCALGAGADPQKLGFGNLRFPSDPENFKIIDDKLYLFARLPGFDAKATWERGDQAELLRRAESFWQSRRELASSIKGLPKGMHPRAPMETAQFAFLLGSWENEVKSMVDIENKRYGQPVKGIWTAKFASEGFGIQDEWRAVGWVGAGGPTIRSFDPVSRKWVMTYIPVNQPRGNTWLMEGAFDEKGNLEGQFESTDRRGRPFIQKVFFYDIEKDRFSWRADRSYDGGKTWIEGFMVAEQKRIQEEPGS